MEPQAQPALNLIFPNRLIMASPYNVKRKQDYACKHLTPVYT